MNKKDILNECYGLVKDVESFNNACDKFKKKYPDSSISCFFFKEINDGGVFQRRFASEGEFYKPEAIVEEEGEILVRCEKWSLFCWSCSTLNKIPLSEFEEFNVVNEEDIKNILKKMKERYRKGLISLQKDTIKQLKPTPKKEKENQDEKM